MDSIINLPFEQLGPRREVSHKNWKWAKIVLPFLPIHQVLELVPSPSLSPEKLTLILLKTAVDEGRTHPLA